MLISLNLCIYDFCQIWEIFTHYFFQYFSDLPLLFFPSGTLKTQVLDHLLYSFKSLRICSSFFSIFFPQLFRLGNFYYVVFKFIDFFPLSLPFCYWSHQLSVSCWLLCFSVLKLLPFYRKNVCWPSRYSKENQLSKKLFFVFKRI